MVLYPTSLDTLTNPSASTDPAVLSHAAQHADANDILEALEAKLGTSASTPTTGKLLVGTGTGASAWTKDAPTGTIVGTSDVQVLTNKTLTSAVLNTPTINNPSLNTDSISEFTSANGITVDGLNIKDGKLNTNNSVVTTNITDAAVSYAKAAAGFAVQVQSTNYSAVATGTTLIPVDNTIPQITEGNEYMTQAITPKSTTNKLRIEISAYISHSAGGDQVGALFQDATANALAACHIYQPGATGPARFHLVHYMTAGTISATTFRFRAGSSVAGTTTFNGQGGSRNFGGITLSNITVTEYNA